MEKREKGWKAAELVIGAVGAALLIVILVLRILKYDVLYLTYPLVAVVVLFLIADERARMLKRKRISEEAARDAEEEPIPENTEQTIPKEACKINEKQCERGKVF